MKKLHSHATGAVLATMLLWGSMPDETPVADAAMQGDADRVAHLIQEGADVNAAHADGMTALHWAAELGNAELATVVLHAGADVQKGTRLGAYTPLHIAAKGQHTEIVKALLDAGADASASTTTGGATPLHFAASTADVESVRALLAAGADVNSRETQWGQTPLIFAASSGRLPIVQALIEAGADLGAQTNVVDMATRAAEDRAAGQVRREVLREFQGDRVAGGDGWLPSPTEVQTAVRAAQDVSRDKVDAARGEVRDVFGNPQDQVDTPTSQDDDEPDPDIDARAAARPAAAPAGDYDSSYPALVGGQGGLTALLHAVREGEGDVVMALLDAGADLDQPSAGDGTTPIVMAAINGHYDMTLELLDRGADPNIGSHAGTTALYAVLNNRWAPKARYPQQEAWQQQETSHYDVMKGLLAAGADPNVRLTKHLWFMEYTFSHLGIDTRGATPFWRAAHALDVPAMQMLVEAGADSDIPTMKPPQRRRYAAAFNRPDREDPSGLAPIPDAGPGVYPIHAATGHGYGTGYAGNSHRHAPDAWLSAVTYLVEELGADVNARDHSGYSPVHNAAARGDMEVLRYLVEKGADVTVLSRRGQTTVDMANGPVQRVQPFPEAMAYLEGLGAVNNHNCLSC